MVYVTGDIHGDYQRLSPSALKFMKPGDTLIICGDFGFIWNESKQEDKILRELGKRRYNICFIDGTHENFGLLNKYPVTKWNSGNVHRITGNLYHLMRGQFYRIEGMSYFTMGGGENPDAVLLDIPVSHKQMPSEEELLEAVNMLELLDYNVDVIITHEPPSRIRDFLAVGGETVTRVSALNTFFDELCRQCKYKKWYFGSLHTDKYISSSQIAVFRNFINAKTGMKAE